MLNYTYVCVCAHIEIKINSYKIIINVNLQSSAEQVAVCVSRACIRVCVCVCVWCEAFYQSVSQPAARLHECACVCVHACIYVYMLNIFISSANWTSLQCINQCNFAIALAGGTHRAQQTDTHTQATATTLNTLGKLKTLFLFVFWGTFTVRFEFVSVFTLRQTRNSGVR